MRGLVMFDRAILDHHIVGRQNPKRFLAWFWLVSAARWKPESVDINGQTIDLERGQLCVSLRVMAKEVGMTLKEVRGFLARLERDQMVSKTGTGITIITICNYDQYQDMEAYRGTARAQQGHSKGTARAHKRIPEKPEKPEKPDKELGSYEPLSSGDDPSAPIPKPVDEIAEAVVAYNEAAEASGWPKVKASVLSKARRAALAARLQECDGIAGWRIALEKAQASNFLCGDNDRHWTANFDFLTQKSSFFKLMEGNYDNRIGNGMGAGARGGGGMATAFAEVGLEASRGAGGNGTGD